MLEGPRQRPARKGRMERALKLLRELIALPSVNPAFLPAGDPRAGERRVGEFVAATGAAWGLDVDFQEVAPERSNVWLRLTPPGRVRQRVVLAPHLDTVGSETPTEAMFQPRLVNGPPLRSWFLRRQRQRGGHAGRPGGNRDLRKPAGANGDRPGGVGGRGELPGGLAGGGGQQVSRGPGDRRRANRVAGGHGAQRQRVAAPGNQGTRGPRVAARVGTQRGAGDGPRGGDAGDRVREGTRGAPAWAAAVPPR